MPSSTTKGAMVKARYPRRVNPRPGPKTQDPRPKTQDPRPKTQDPRPKTQGPGPKTQGPRPRTQGPRLRTEGCRRTALDARPRTPGAMREAPAAAPQPRCSGAASQTQARRSDIRDEYPRGGNYQPVPLLGSDAACLVRALHACLLC
jgi:hypothetical protein